MSNHFSAANLKYPGDDARLDLTGLFVFAAHDDPGQTVLIIDANPFMTGPGFHPDSVLRINIDSDGDLHADAAFTFSDFEDGRQTVTAYYATGAQAGQPEPAGEVLIQDTPVGFDGAAQPVQAGPARLFAGVRSDPFFADADGAMHGFAWTGNDTFAGTNILSIALEVPGGMLGAGPASYPNGRPLTDNVFGTRIAFLTNGKAGSDGLHPHDDLLAGFPYLGPPNT